MNIVVCSTTPTPVLYGLMLGPRAPSMWRQHIVPDWRSGLQQVLLVVADHREPEQEKLLM